MARKKATSKQQLPPDSLDALFGTPEARSPEHSENQGNDGGNDGDSMKDLLARFDALEAESRRKDQTIASLLAQPQIQTQQRQEPTVPEVNFDGLPDPVSDPTGYQKAISKRIAEAIDGGVKSHLSAYQSREQAEETEAERAAALWDSFRKDYSDLAEHEDLVRASAARVLQQVKNSGIDGERYMLANQQQFFKDIDADMRSRYGKLFESDEDDGSDPGDEDDGRAAAVFGGTMGSGKPAPKPAGVKSMDDEISVFQRKMGLY